MVSEVAGDAARTRHLVPIAAAIDDLLIAQRCLPSHTPGEQAAQTTLRRLTLRPFGLGRTELIGYAASLSVLMTAISLPQCHSSAPGYAPILICASATASSSEAQSNVAQALK